MPSELKRIVLGAPSYGSPDPSTSANSLLPRTDLPKKAPITDASAKESVSPLKMMLKADLLDTAELAGVEDQVNDDMTKDEIVEVISNNLDNLSKEQLWDLCEGLEVERKSSDTKADLINRLRAS